MLKICAKKFVIKKEFQENLGFYSRLLCGLRLNQADIIF